MRAARREIDDNIAELERTVRYLKTKRNELSPVSVLPNEVLSNIFILVRDLPIELWVDNLQTRHTMDTRRIRSSLVLTSPRR